MKGNEAEIIRRTERLILDRVTEPTRLADFLFENGRLTAGEIEEVYETKTTRRETCRLLMDICCCETSVCSLCDLIEALRRTDDTLKDLAEEIKQTADDNDVPVTVDRPNDIVYEKVRKVNVYTTSRSKRVKALGHRLTCLAHEGDVAAFNDYITRIHAIYQKCLNSRNMDVVKGMEIADLRFACLEAEIVLKRVFYDTCLYRNSIFKELEKIIPYTSNPTVSSMTFLARSGSAMSMNDGVETGLSYIQYSKHHAENSVPCRDTAMVYYIEINLLFQQYQACPTYALKQRILKTAELAISQLENETEDVTNSYKRIFLIKMAFCRLGIGIWGDRIEGAVVDEDDIHATKNYLDLVELPEIWTGVEARRQMLFNIAKAEYFKRQTQIDMAVIFAREARKLAIESQWKKELPSINLLMNDLETEMEIEKSKAKPDAEVDDLTAEIVHNIEKLEASV